jgi:guanine deaminase
MIKAGAICERIVCGTLWHLRDSSFEHPDFEEIKEGAIAICKEGKILAVGTEKFIISNFKARKTDRFPQSFLLPGFIDSHIHFPQMFQIGSYGESLLGWLEKYIFPEEEKMAAKGMAQKHAPLFFRELFRNGTTTSLIFSNSDAKTTDLLFRAAKTAGARAVIGKSSMDRGAPQAVLRGISQDKEDTEELIQNWHTKENRLFYALTPRFSPSCSPKLLTMLGLLAEKYPTVRIQTHFSENVDELKLVKKLFPKSQDYLATYEDFGLINERTVLAHAIHAKDSEITRIKKRGAKISHCPTSNLFLGSGLFPLKKFSQKKITTSVGTDVGAGTSFSIWSTLATAYQVQRVQGEDVHPAQLFYLATLGGARALGLDSQVGNFQVGKFADIQVLNWQKSPILKTTVEKAGSPWEQFFACLFQFEKSLITDVYVQGKKVL